MSVAEIKAAPLVERGFLFVTIDAGSDFGKRTNYEDMLLSLWSINGVVLYMRRAVLDLIYFLPVAKYTINALS